MFNRQPLLNVVLIAPEIPQNTGNIIRLCANTGARLHLVEPLGFRLEDGDLRRAALDYRDIADLVIHHTTQAFFQTVSIDRVFGAIVDAPTSYTAAEYRAGDTIIFGSESDGLSQNDISRLLPDNRLRIPMLPANRSLNLSNAVAIVVYEMWRQLGFSGATIN
jgi:tRNA (cytidine/uridine-2'-O-)-methyltransferase